MDIEALSFVGAYTVVAGTVLYLPFFLWKKWHGKNVIAQTGVKMLSSILLRTVVSAALLVIGALVAFAWLHTATGWLNIVIMWTWLLGAIVLLFWSLSPFRRPSGSAGDKTE